MLWAILYKFILMEALILRAFNLILNKLLSISTQDLFGSNFNIPITEFPLLMLPVTEFNSTSRVLTKRERFSRHMYWLALEQWERSFLKPGETNSILYTTLEIIFKTSSEWSTLSMSDRVTREIFHRLTLLYANELTHKNEIHYRSNTFFNSSFVRDHESFSD